MRELIDEIHALPGNFFHMIRVNAQDTSDQYLSALMDQELTHFLDSERYDRCEGGSNPRNGSYSANITLKGIGEVSVKSPPDTKGEFSTQVSP